MEILEFDDVGKTVFGVDGARRIIRALVVPWNKVGRHRNGRTWRFARGALRYGAAKYIRFNDEHRPRWLGRAVHAEDTDAGLVIDFRVHEGPDGDRALAQASSREKTGFSVEVEIDAADTEPDPVNIGALLVNMAHLTGVGFVKNPAFTDSRLISVTASHEGTVMDTCQHCGAQLTPGVAHTCPTPAAATPPAAPAATPPAAPAATPPAAPVMFSADQLAWMQHNGLGIAQPPAPVQTPPPARVVQPPQPAAVVTEPQPYRFDEDGHLQAGTHDLGVDIVRGMNPKFNDLAARQRVEAFVAAQFDVATGDVNELNPTINQNRYIDQRTYQSPVWNRINKGAPPNGVQPFAWPKFNTASGMVGAHTEGVEPTSGTLTVTNQTVTPTATSGKAKITRETWDMGGTPGTGNLIWRQMTRGYVEALEAKAVAVLDAATPTAIALTAGGGITGQTLVRELRTAFARLQFIRGGFSMDSMFAQVDLYLGLINAQTTDGAYYFPALNPANRDGTVSQRYGAVDVNGVITVPSWALAATGSVVASSYLFDSGSVDGWATPPRQLTMPEIEVAHVYMGIWGYSATAINDITGVREITYDPVA